MVIGPDELLEDIMKGETENLKLLEKKIDAELKRNFDGHCLVTLGHSLFTGFKQCTIDTVISKYSDAGWEVEYISNQRDGEYYAFKKKEREK